MELLLITRYYGGNCRVDIVVCLHEVSHRQGHQNRGKAPPTPITTCKQHYEQSAKKHTPRQEIHKNSRSPSRGKILLENLEAMLASTEPKEMQYVCSRKWQATDRFPCTTRRHDERIPPLDTSCAQSIRGTEDRSNTDHFYGTVWVRENAVSISCSV